MMNPNLKYDAPTYDIFIASERVGVKRPEDSRWVKRTRDDKLLNCDEPVVGQFEISEEWC